MSRLKTKLRGRIKVTVDVQVGDWSGDTIDTDAIFKQVREEGIKKLEKLLEGSEAIVGTPIVWFVIMEEDR